MNDERGPRRSGLSAQTRQRLEQELAGLRVRHHDLDEALSDTDGVDDRGDRAKRLELADDLARLSARIREISEVLAGRVRPSSEDVLPEGTQVIVRFGNGSTDTMTVVTVPEDTAETLTRDSPLGRALVGAQPGDTITYLGPDARSSPTCSRFDRPPASQDRSSARPFGVVPVPFLRGYQGGVWAARRWRPLGCPSAGCGGVRRYGPRGSSSPRPLAFVADRVLEAGV